MRLQPKKPEISQEHVKAETQKSHSEKIAQTAKEPIAPKPSVEPLEPMRRRPERADLPKGRHV
ncbi:MAG: hypothetical protein ACK5V4_05580 [Alphaproteobacteria bacterium]